MAYKILLADDSITIQKVVNLTFTDEGIDVVTVGNGELALKKFSEDSFDLVLADIFMPGRNGYEVCEHIKTDPRTAHVPVVLLVGAFEPFDRSEASRVRADGHLTKPFESRILVDTVKRMLAQSAARPGQPAAASAPAPPPQPSPGAWSAPTPHEEEEPGPPSYDPYVSTAKLPNLNQMLGKGNQTMSMGSPFTPQADESLEPSAPFSFDMSGPQGAPGGDPFSFDATASGTTPLTSDASDSGPSIFEAPVDFAPPQPPPPMQFAQRTSVLSPSDNPFAESHPIEGRPEPPNVHPTGVLDVPSGAHHVGYQPVESGDSPLDLGDFGAVEHNRFEDVPVAERRDPLLESFNDVAESTAHVDSSPDPELVPNAVPEGEASFTVQPIDLLPAYDRESEVRVGGSAAPWEDPTVAHEPVTRTGDLGSEAAPPDWTPHSGASSPAAGAEAPEESDSSRAGMQHDENATQPGMDVSSDADADADMSDRTQAYQAFTPPYTPVEEQEVPAEADAEARIAIPSGPLEHSADPFPLEPEREPVPAADMLYGEAPPLPAAELAELESPLVGGFGSDTGEYGFVPPPPPVSDEPLEMPVATADDETEVYEAVEPIPVPSNGSGPTAEPAGFDEPLAAIPSDIIEEIVRRTVERMSDDVIREIAWEVVPDLAEMLIRKHLNERR